MPRRVAPARFARHDQPFARLVDDADEWNLRRHRGRLIAARVVDDQDFVRPTRLRQDGMKTSWKIARFVMRADDDRDPQIPRHRCAIVLERRGIPTRICPQPNGAQ